VYTRTRTRAGVGSFPTLACSAKAFSRASIHTPTYVTLAGAKPTRHPAVYKEFLSTYCGCELPRNGAPDEPAVGLAGCLSAAVPLCTHFDTSRRPER
jgi:hypothetical protein